jgi:hypothetical protein
MSTALLFNTIRITLTLLPIPHSPLNTMQWAEIAKRIPGRNESSVKNRWYNVRTSKKKAEQKKKSKTKKRQLLEEALEAEHEEELLDTKVPALSPVKKKGEDV